MWVSFVSCQYLTVKVNGLENMNYTDQIGNYIDVTNELKEQRLTRFSV